MKLITCPSVIKRGWLENPCAKWKFLVVSNFELNGEFSSPSSTWPPWNVWPGAATSPGHGMPWLKLALGIISTWKSEKPWSWMKLGVPPPPKKISSASKFIHHVPFEQFWTWFIKLAGLTAHGQDFSRYRTRLKGPVMNNGPVNTECTRVSWPGIAYRKSLGTHADSHTSCFTGVKLWELNSAWFLRFLLLPSKFCAVSVCVQNLQEEVKLHAFGQAIVQHDRGMYPQNLVTTIGKLFKCFHFHVLILVTQWLSHRSHLDLQVYRNSNDSPATCDHSDVIGDKRLLPSSFHSRIWILSSPQSRRGCDLQLPCLIAGCKLHSVKLLCKLV